MKFCPILPEHLLKLASDLQKKCTSFSHVYEMVLGKPVVFNTQEAPVKLNKKAKWKNYIFASDKS